MTPPGHHARSILLVIAVLVIPSAGEDSTSGGPGDDFISGQRGSPEPDIQPDVYYGGSGDDYIAARAGGRDTVGCGTGHDEAEVDREDELLDDACERVRIDATARSGS